MGQKFAIQPPLTLPVETIIITNLEYAISQTRVTVHHINQHENGMIIAMVLLIRIGGHKTVSKKGG